MERGPKARAFSYEKAEARSPGLEIFYGAPFARSPVK